VTSFGINEYVPAHKVREQVEIVYFEGLQDRPEAPSEFAMDLCKNSFPHQVVLAYIQRGESLLDTLQRLEKKMALEPHLGDVHGRLLHQLSSTDSLLIPNMQWSVQHHFRELEGREKPIINPKLHGYIDQAMQVIHFELTRSGVSLSSEARTEVKSEGGPRHFDFNRPFLLYMKKRGAKHPFFVMWVDNAELLIKN
jgi:hypothetical protein